MTISTLKKQIIKSKLKQIAKRYLSRRGKSAFLSAIPLDGKVLDVGAGNNSPFQFKALRPDLYYVGLDIGDYNQQQSPALFADQYIITSPENFAEAIRKFGNTFDGVISAHNLEHCLAPDEVLRAMLKALRSGGRIYLAFPCEDSAYFPKRHGSLNFYDDPTHLKIPDFSAILNLIKAEGLTIDFVAKRYRPLVPFLLGLILEPFSLIWRRVMPVGSTWALYGFETVIWASRRK